MPQQLEPTHDFPKIGAPAQRALANAGYTHLEALANVSETDVRTVQCDVKSLLQEWMCLQGGGSHILGKCPTPIPTLACVTGNSEV